MHDVVLGLHMCLSMYACAWRRHRITLCPLRVHAFLQVHVSCQSVTGVAEAVAAVLGVPIAKVHVKTRRLGGSFGGKATYAMRVSASASCMPAVRQSACSQLAVS